MIELLNQFGDDPTVRLLGGLVVLDLIFGVGAAIASKDQKFSFSYLADFLRNDILGKLVPYYGLWAVLHVTGDITIAGFDGIEESVGLAIAVALGASVLNSARDLHLLPAGTPDSIAGPDMNTPG